MATKRTTNTKKKAPSVKVKRRGVTSRVAGGVRSRTFSRFVLPLVVSAFLLAGLMFLVFSGYQTATASSFFELKAVDIRGNDMTPPEDVRRIVIAGVEKNGVWNADLSDIRSKIEKFPFVKTAAVSRVLPGGIRVNILERVPAAVVHLSSGNFLIDSEGAVLGLATGNNNNFPFILQGWDEAKTEKAVPDNIARLKLYKKMLDDWKQFDLSSRVKEVNLSNPREPVAVVEDSGKAVPITLARDNLGKSLKTAIEALSGKGARVRSVDAGGVFPVIQYLD